MRHIYSLLFSRTLRRFYQNQGVPLAKNEVHIMYSSTGLVIEIALNNYGLKEIRRLNHNAIYDIRTSALLNMSHLNRGSWIRTNAFWILFYPCTASSSKTTGIFPYMAASLPLLITFAS